MSEGLPATREEDEELAFLRASGLFDQDWFDARNPDLVAAGLDSLVHFHRYGWREFRLPNAYFDTAWYLRANRDVAEAGVNPLLHYARYGEAEGRKPTAHFEPDWYRAKHGLAEGVSCLAHFLQHRLEGWVSPVPEFDPIHYLSQSPDVAQARMDPFEHYMVVGAAEDRSPSSLLDVRYYKARYLRFLPNTNPLMHYRRHRHEPGVFATPSEEDGSLPQLIGRHSRPGPLFEPVLPMPATAKPKAKLLAFYLPQFHPVPENDRWWGDGFTEWTNVARAVPRFVGHYQPRIPRDLGYYRLDDPATLGRQIRLAQAAGIHAFVFYFYWFNGQRLLEKPLDTFLADQALTMPFCLMWANENWTRRWDGSEQDVLLSQDYRDEDEEPLIKTFARHFDDSRYLRLEGRPVLMVYRAGLIPGGAATVARWRTRFAGLGHHPVFVMAQSFGERDPAEVGMDAAVEFPPHKLTERLPQVNERLRWLDYTATARVFDYDAVAHASDLGAPSYPLIRTALPGWDNDARRQGRGMVIHGATPAAYQAWLGRLIEAAREQTVFGEALVCINAWNEWAEGAYLEPDVHFGAAFLNATARAVASPGPRRALSRLLLVGHDAFPAGAQLLLLNLTRELVRRGIEVTVLLLGGGALEAEYQAVAPTTVFEGAAELVRHAASLAASGFRAAIVNTSAAGSAAAALAREGIGCTLLLHEMPRLLRERRWIEGAKAGIAAAEHVVFAAEFVRERYQEVVAVPSDRVRIVPQGVYRPVDPAGRADYRARLRLAREAKLAVGLGYADLRKGFDLFLQAWRLAQQADATLHFLWVGDLDPVVNAYLGAEIAAAMATGTFHHLPYQPDGGAWLAAADVHLLTSREDPYPSVVLEAMSAGVPTVAFDEAGSAPDLLRDLRAGVGVPLGDAAAMVREASTLIRTTEPEQRARLVRLARQRFPFEAYAERILALALPPPPSVSAMVPTLDYADHLPARLLSIFAQTLAPSEIVVLDDGSDDDSEAVVRRVSRREQRKVTWVATERRGGVGAQFRRAAGRARGEFVWIAEADDVADPFLLERLTAALLDVPEAPFGFVDSRAIDAAGVTLWEDYQDYYRASGALALTRSGAIPAARFLVECLAARNLVVNASAVLWRRTALIEAIEHAGSLLDRFRFAGDWLLYAEALRSGGPAVFVAEPLNRHRRHRASLTAQMDVDEHLAEIKRMHRHMRAMLGERPDVLAAQREALRAARRHLAA